MPQVWNPRVHGDMDQGGFSKSSRFSKLSNFSDASLRRIKVRNSLEGKLSGINLAYLNRTSNLSAQRIEHARKDIQERHKRFRAYKLVVQRHPIQARRSYAEALNDNYSQHALRHEVRRMLGNIDPQRMRRRKAENMVQRSRDEYSDTMTRNRAAIVDLVPKPKPVEVVVEEEEDLRSPTPPPPVNKTFRRSIVGPPLRGLVPKPQAVSLQMVKEKTWMGTGGAPRSPEKASGDPMASLNPHAVLPSIQT